MNFQVCLSRVKLYYLAIVLTCLFGNTTYADDNPDTLYITPVGGGDYVCDGTQDQIEINMALDRVASDDSLTTVYLKGPMTCVIDEPIIISSNTRLIGDANVKVKLKEHTDWEYNEPMIAQKGGEHWVGGAHEGSLEDQIYGTPEDAISNVEIAGFELTTGIQNAVPGSWYYLLMIFYGASDVTVHDMYLHDNYSDFIRIASPLPGMNKRVKIYNNLMENSGHDGVYLSYISDLEIYNNKIYHTRTNDGIRVGQCDHISIHGNTIGNSLDEVPSGYAGIMVSNNEEPVVSAEIYENYIFGKAGGIVLVGGRTKDLMNNVHIHHNRIFKIYDNTAGGDYFLNGGIHLHGAHNTLIEFNTIEGSYKDGIVFEIWDGRETEYKTIVRNNIISNCAGYGLNNIDSDKHTFISEYNDIYNNSAGNYSTGSSDTDIHVDPLYVHAEAADSESDLDLHLKSEYGRWNGETWVMDSETSPCIDQGAPATNYSLEPSPNGGRVNIGAYGNTVYASKSSTAGTTNQSPIADAGPDKTLTDTNGDGAEPVTLDGSGSSDPDGNIVSYSWKENGDEIATGVAPLVNLLVGMHTLTLTVMDNEGAVTSDTVIITVNEQTQYTLTYTAGANGSISGTTLQTVASGADGTEVTAVADAGYHFVNWSDGVTTASRTDTHVTADITVTASFEEDAASTYALTVTSGSGDGDYTADTAVSITAEAAPAGQHFVNWTTSNGGTFADANSPTTTFTMPANDVTVTANYADEAAGESTIYEDAEDGLTLGWSTGGSVTNVADAEHGGKVIELSGSGAIVGFTKYKDDMSDWNNTEQFIFKWSMKTSGYFEVYVRVETSEGLKFLYYTATDDSWLAEDDFYIHHGLGSNAADGSWHTFTRDLQADLSEAYPGSVIYAVQRFDINTESCKVDDISLSTNMPR